MEKISANVITKTMKVNIDGKEMSFAKARKLQNKLLHQVFDKSISKEEYENSFRKAKEIDDILDKRLDAFSGVDDLKKFRGGEPYTNEVLKRKYRARLPFMQAHQATFGKYKDMADSPANDHLSRKELNSKFPLYSARVDPVRPNELAQLKAISDKSPVLKTIRQERIDHVNKTENTPTITQRMADPNDRAIALADLRANKAIKDLEKKHGNDPFLKPTIDRQEEFERREKAFNTPPPPNKKVRSLTEELTLPPHPPSSGKKPYSSPNVERTIASGKDTTPIESKDLEKNLENLEKYRKDLRKHTAIDVLVNVKDPLDQRIINSNISEARKNIHDTLIKIQDIKNKPPQSQQFHEGLEHLPKDVQRSIAIMRGAFVKKSSLDMSKIALDIDQVNKVLNIAKQRGDLVDLREGGLTKKRINVLKGKLNDKLKNENIGGSLRRKLLKLHEENIKASRGEKGSFSSPQMGEEILRNANQHGEFYAGVNKKTNEPQLKSKKLARIANMMGISVLQNKDVYSPPTHDKKAQDLYRGLVGLHELSEQKSSRSLTQNKNPGRFYSSTTGTNSSHMDKQVLEDLNRVRALKGEGAGEAGNSIRVMRDPEINRMIQIVGDPEPSNVLFKPVDIKNTNKLQKLLSAQGHGDLIENEVIDNAIANEIHNQKILSKVPARLHNHPMVQSRLKPTEYQDNLDYLRNNKYKINSKLRDHIYNVLDNRATDSNMTNNAKILGIFRTDPVKEVKHRYEVAYPKKDSKVTLPNVILNNPKLGSQTRKMR